MNKLFIHDTIIKFIISKIKYLDFIGSYQPLFKAKSEAASLQ